LEDDIYEALAGSGVREVRAEPETILTPDVIGNHVSRGGAVGEVETIG